MTNATARPPIAKFQTPEMFSAVRAVVLATAYFQLIRDQVKPVQQATINAASLKMDLTDGSPITNMKDSYLSTDETATTAMHADYARRLIAAGRFGLTEAEILDGKCPELVAEWQKIQAENLLIDLIAPLLNFSRVSLTMDARKKLIDLTLSMVINMPSFDKNSPKL